MIVWDNGQLMLVSRASQKAGAWAKASHDIMQLSANVGELCPD